MHHTHPQTNRVVQAGDLLVADYLSHFQNRPPTKVRRHTGTQGGARGGVAAARHPVTTGGQPRMGCEPSRRPPLAPQDLQAPF